MRRLIRYVRSQNSSRIHLLRVNRQFAASIPPGALVLDAAAGDQPYKVLFEHARYEAADFEMVDKPYARSTYVCDLRSIPVPDSRFDYIIFNQAMEHMPEPLEVLRELHRVLKPGGRMLTTAPFFYQEHEVPYDFYRYTQFAYKHLFPKAGFEIQSIEWLEGYLGTLAYQLETAAMALPRIYFPFRFLFAMLAIWFYHSDVRQPYRRAGYPKNYVVLSVKPGEDGPQRQ
jgi:ubiquinone/menaquinone biosynthesis C-methylase UbiE